MFVLDAMIDDDGRDLWTVMETGVETKMITKRT